MVDVAPQSSLEELEESIFRAMQRVNAEKEAELCHYLPGKNGREASSFCIWQDEENTAPRATHNDKRTHPRKGYPSNSFLCT